MNATPDRPGDAPASYGIDEDEPLPPVTVYLSIALPAGATPGGLAEIQRALADTAQRMTRLGHPVRYVNGMYMPAQPRLLCVFAAESEETAHATVRRLGLSFVPLRVVGDGPGPDHGNG